MKKTISKYILLLVVITSIISCTRDDDNQYINPDLIGKRIISQLAYTCQNEDGLKEGELIVNYGDRQQIIGFTEFSKFVSNEGEVTFTNNFDSFRISDDILTMNEDGKISTWNISSSHVTSGRDIPFIFTYSNGYIESTTINSKTIFDYEWKNENLVRETNTTKIEFTYTDKENKMNLDPADIDDENETAVYFLSGYWGKRSKNLVSKIVYDGRLSTTYDYTFDKDGYVTKFTTTNSGLNEDKYQYDITYKK